MALKVKVCGLKEPARIEQAAALGAAYVGLVFYPPSPRYVDPARARELVLHVPAGVETVGVLVDATDAEIDAILQTVPLDILQLHGYETPERVEAIALRSGCRVMKAIRVEEAADLEQVPAYIEAADMILFDAKPPRDAGWPGGHGLPFDWRLLRGLGLGKPWALAGGLHAGNLETAVTLTGAPIIDVSSGVEAKPGVKDPEKLEAFFAAVRRIADRAAP
ncbi:phosphoribosylanthranilate isomerase [Benzoatithermus flavus]|uniref:N-(5'-phosphoribosyl)anthranilate isomerase n=1 Tax=Benzoatithermus flavus TaxID=3108223 RepID=A0ABU8XQ04_9PROT